MQIRPDQLDTALGKSLLPVYLVSGDEPLQQMEACDSIREDSFMRSDSVPFTFSLKELLVSSIVIGVTKSHRRYHRSLSPSKRRW